MQPIVLQDTLGDFFKEEAKEGPGQVTFLSYHPITDNDLTTNIARNRKYMIQQWRAPGQESFSAMLNLVLMPQRLAWIAGNIPVIFLQTNEQVEEMERFSSDNVEQDLTALLQQLTPQHRFAARFCASWDEVRATSRGTKLLPFLPCDQDLPIPHLINPDVHYELLSKRGLALSGLQTPSPHVIDFKPPEKGWTADLVARETERALGEIAGRTIPFVLKCNSSGGSAGVYFVKSSDDLARTKQSVKRHLQRELHQLGPLNAHLNPLSLVLMDLILGDTHSINFYVLKDGRARFSSCVQQVFSSSDHWLGAKIKYSSQSYLAELFSRTITNVAHFLHSKGYFGPAGIDVMIDEKGTQTIVDLNPRPTGSFVLGCLKSYFTDQMNFDEAEVLPVMELQSSRSEFNKIFRTDLENSHIIVLAWYSNRVKGTSSAALLVAGRDRQAVCDVYRRVETWRAKPAIVAGSTMG